MPINSLHISAILCKQFLFHIDLRLKFTEGSQKLQNQSKNETACALFITGCRPFRLLYSTCLSFGVHPKRTGGFTAPVNPSAPASRMMQ